MVPKQQTTLNEWRTQSLYKPVKQAALACQHPGVCPSDLMPHPSGKDADKDIDRCVEVTTRAALHHPHKSQKHVLQVNHVRNSRTR